MSFFLSLYPLSSLSLGILKEESSNQDTHHGVSFGEVDLSCAAEAAAGSSLGTGRERAEAAKPPQRRKVGRCRRRRRNSSSSPSLGRQQRRRPRGLLVEPGSQNDLPHHVPGVVVEVELLLGVDDDDAACCRFYFEEGEILS